MYIHETLIFRDRKDAGERLGKALHHLYAESMPIVLGIPRGGVEIAYYVAQQLNAAFSVVVSKKLGFPERPEFGVGAIAEGDHVYVPSKRLLQNERSTLNEIIEQERTEINRRLRLYRKGAPLPSLRNRTVLIVDDGIATGVTMVPVLELCREQKPAEIIVAAPVGTQQYDPMLNGADRIIMLYQPAFFAAVSQFYDNFEQLSDEAVLHFLEGSAVPHT